MIYRIACHSPFNTEKKWDKNVIIFIDTVHLRLRWVAARKHDFFHHFRDIGWGKLTLRPTPPFSPSRQKCQYFDELRVVQ